MSETNETKEVVSKKKKWVVPVIIGAAVAVVLAIAIAAIFFATAPKRALQKQLDAADKYLADLDYENAILAYETAIEMDPKDERGYLGLANVYEALADRDIEEEKYTSAKDYLEKGITVLEKGIAETDSDKLKTKKTVLEEKIKSLPDEVEAEVEEGDSDDGAVDELQGELKEFPVQKLKDGVKIQHADGGVVIVWRQDEQTGEYFYGAVDSTGKEIASVQYQSYKEPNDNGYFVMISGHYNEYGEYEDDKYTLYSPDGKIIYEGPYNVVASNEAYIIAKQEKIRDETGAYPSDYKMEYYDYSGKLLVSVDGYDAYGEPIEPAVFVNGKSIVLRNPEEYYSRDLEERLLNYDMGFVSPDGSIEWTDGDGIDISKVDCVDMEEAKKIEDEKNKSYIGAGIGSVVYIDEGYRPMSNFVDGYMTEKYLGGVAPLNFVMRDEAGNECVIDPWHMVLNPDGTIQYNIRKETTFGKTTLCLDNGYSAQGSITNVNYISYNGGYVGNYGSKMQMTTRDGKQILVDVSVKTGKLTYKMFDYLDMSMEKYWLISKDGKWGYCDHDGNEVKMFDDAAAFYHGYAIIIENGTAYLINEEFEKVQTIGAADSSAQLGQVFVITKGEDSTYYLLQ